MIRDLPSLSKYRPLLLLLSLLLVSALAAGCVAPRPGISDLERYPQDLSVYLRPDTAQAPLVAPERQAELNADFDRHFFAPWQPDSVPGPAAEVFWGVRGYNAKAGFAENLLPWQPERWNRLVAAQQMESYPSLARPAITVRNVSFRVFPTARPFFLNPARPGEGFPFDYFQNSAVWAGTPLLVTHRSADGVWLLAESGFAGGWLPADAVAWAETGFRATYQNGHYAALLRDEVTLRDGAGNPLLQTHLGAIFPVTECGEGRCRLLVPLRDQGGEAVLREALAPANDAALKPLPLNPAGLAAIGNGLLGQPYGWGGLFEDRDCSATLRDLFTPFGLWLPRNSAAQAHSGNALRDLSGLSAGEKRALILADGIPFYTLVWLKGHIGLYLGADRTSGEPLLLHNLWGVRTSDATGREGRALIGRLVVTSLHPGEERSDVREDAFLDRVRGIRILPGFVPR